MTYDLNLQLADESDLHLPYLTQFDTCEWCIRLVYACIILKAKQYVLKLTKLEANGTEKVLKMAFLFLSFIIFFHFKTIHESFTVMRSNIVMLFSLYYTQLKRTVLMIQYTSMIYNRWKYKAHDDWWMNKRKKVVC